MARESIYTLMRPGFPKETADSGAYRNEIEYIGLFKDIQAANCRIGIPWGEYPGYVTSAQAEPLEGTSPKMGILTVVVERRFDAADYSESGTGEKTETNYEEEWVNVSRSMLEHPEFAIGGGGTYELTSEDVCSIEKWKNEEDVEKKKIFNFQKSNDGTYSELGTEAQMFARGIQLGVETWDDFAPVIRVTSVYLNGKPPSTEAGQKDNPPSEADGPSGYQWRKSGARRIHTGGQNRWELIEEWTGCKKVLVDKDEIFWTPP